MPAPVLVDTHAHLDSEPFLGEGQLEPYLQLAREANLGAVISVGCSAASSMTTVQLARTHSLLHAAVGIQPNDCCEAAQGDWDQIVALASDAKVVALGETGLDCYWDKSPLLLQQDYFDRHLRLSQQTGLPFIVHLRESQEEILGMLREARKRGPLRGVMHSYTGDAAGAAECVELGLYVSFAGMVTFKSAHDLREVARQIPADRILIETDSPYLTPHPHRGKRPNHPAMVTHTATCLAECRGESFSEIAAQTTANACRLFKISIADR